MVGHGNRQDERQHPNVVHGPNSSPHRTRPAQQPNRASPTTGGCYAACKVQSSVGRKDGNQHRKRHQRVIVRANQVHGSHGTPSGCHAEQLPFSMIYSVTDGTFPFFLPSETGNVPSVPGLCPSPGSETGCSTTGSRVHISLVAIAFHFMRRRFGLLLYRHCSALPLRMRTEI